MKEEEIIAKLAELQRLPAETEVVEFKQAKNSYDVEKIGKYFSAISNEANLRGYREGWLVFGIEDDTKKIVGTSYRQDKANLDKLKTEIAQKTTDSISFTEIYEVIVPEGRVIMFQIPAAPQGIPISWDGHWYARESDAQQPLNLEKLERIRRQTAEHDWSISICSDASMDDLDYRAIKKARANYANKNPQLLEEIHSWNDEVFLNKAKLTINSKITRTAILLLGKPESSHFISPAQAQISWILKDRDGNERSYKHFSCPFLLAVDEAYNAIRNLRYQYIPSGTIIPDEVDQYEPFNIREALNNCIAHQDYTLAGRISIVEREDNRLIFSNLGIFLPGSIDSVIQSDAPPEKYRNRFLADAMVNLQMIDTIGSGIRRIFNNQRKRFFPMPDYDISNRKVKVTIIGKILDMDYARILARNPHLTLEEIMMLDKLQKGHTLTTDAIKHLRRKGLVEGHKSHLHISKEVAVTTGQEIEYALAKGLDDEYFKEMITRYMKSSDSYLSRTDFEKLLIPKLPESMTHEQRQNKVKNLLQDLRRAGVIQTNEDRSWQLVDEIR